MLVLDDYHLITNPQIQESVAAFVDHLPRVLELALATRSTPALPLARLRARGELVEIDAADLSFSVEDADSLLNDLHGLGLEHDAVERLQERTEGWAAGLYLASLTLRGRGHAYAEEFVREFAGDDRHVVDYLSAEVLSGQPAEVRAFLLRTSLLDRFCAPLCDAVTGGDGRTPDPARDGVVELLPHPARQQARLVPLPPPVRGAAPAGAGADRARERRRAAPPGVRVAPRSRHGRRRPSATPRPQATSRTRRR